MITTILYDLPMPVNAEFAPMLLMGLAVALVIILQIFKASVTSIFLSAFAVIFAAWLACFLGASLDDLGVTIYGLNFDGRTQLAFKLLFPALMGIAFMIYKKDAHSDKKTAALLMLLISFIGGMIVLTSKNWMVFFIGVQCMSIPIYGLVAFDTNNKMSLNSSVKYLILSIIAMAFLLFGIVLFYAATGDMDFVNQTNNTATTLFALAMILVGIGFKTSLFPFHVWAPDVYQGSSLFATSYLLVIVKAFMVLFLLENLEAMLGESAFIVTPVLTTLAVITMWIGNGMMLMEKNFLRLIGFLSIGHLGFLMVPLLAQGSSASAAIFIDLTAFGVAIIVTLFTIKLLSSQSINSFKVEDFTGLFRQAPTAAVFLAIGIAALMGLPLTAGFLGKYAILTAGVLHELWFLTLNMILSSLLGIVALAKILVVMLEDPLKARRWRSFSKGSRILLFISSFSLLFFGIIPEPWVGFIKNQAETRAPHIVKNPNPDSILTSRQRAF